MVDKYIEVSQFDAYRLIELLHSLKMKSDDEDKNKSYMLIELKETNQVGDESDPPFEEFDSENDVDWLAKNGWINYDIEEVEMTVKISKKS